MNEKLKTILTEVRRYLAELYGARLVDVVLYGSQVFDMPHTNFIIESRVLPTKTPKLK